MMKLGTQDAFNKTLYDQINKLADKIKSGISPDNFLYITDDLIDTLKRVEKYENENIPYDSNSTINSYQVRELKQIIRYLKSMRTEFYSEEVDEKLSKSVTQFRAPEGYSALKSFLYLNRAYATFKSSDGDETDEGLSKTVSGNNVELHRYIDGVSYDQANSSEFISVYGTLYFWRYK